MSVLRRIDAAGTITGMISNPRTSVKAEERPDKSNALETTIRPAINII
jgi:hypothetical protein